MYSKLKIGLRLVAVARVISAPRHESPTKEAAALRGRCLVKRVKLELQAIALTQLADKSTI